MLLWKQGGEQDIQDDHKADKHLKVIRHLQKWCHSGAKTTNPDDTRTEAISKDINAKPIAEGKETSPVTRAKTYNDKDN